MYEPIILTFTLFGSIYLMGKSMEQINRLLITDPHKNLNMLFILNNLVFISSGITFMYCLHHSFNLLTN